MQKYESKSYLPLQNAQHNLSGKTHYVDDSTLRFFKARVLRSGHTDNGLLFWLVESSSKNFDNTERGFRFVVFDVFGNVINHDQRKEWYTSSERAKKAMWAYLNTLDAINITKHAIDSCERYQKDEIERSKKELADLAAAS